MHANSNSEPGAPLFVQDPRWEIPRELAACKALAFKQLEAFAGILHRRAAPGRLDHTQDVPHAVRRLRCPTGLIIGQEMRQHQAAPSAKESLK